MDLKAWTIQYLKHRDIFYKKIVSIEQNEKGLLIKEKDEEKQIIVSSRLTLPDAEKTIVVANKKENLDFLIENWEQFSKNEGLKIIFANPKTNEKWIIIPSHHAKIAEAESLKVGLEAMFNEVSEV